MGWEEGKQDPDCMGGGKDVTEEEVVLVAFGWIHVVGAGEQSGGSALT